MPIVIGAKRESDFTDPIGMLGDCHRRIERFLHVLLTLSTNVKGDALTRDQQVALATSLRYFRESAPKHTADEEESLFPRLSRVDHPGLQPLLAQIGSLEQDHECARKTHAEVDVLGQLWLANGRLSPSDAERLFTLLSQLGKMYQQHIAMEDAEVFPFAASVLSSPEREQIGAEMAARRSIGTSGPFASPGSTAAVE